MTSGVGLSGEFRIIMSNVWTDLRSSHGEPLKKSKNLNDSSRFTF